MNNFNEEIIGEDASVVNNDVSVANNDEEKETQDQYTTEASSANTVTEEDILNMPDSEIEKLELSNISIAPSNNVSETEENNQVPAESTTEKSDNPDVEAETTQDTSSEPEEIAFYKQVTAPFKANGTQVQIKDPRDAIRLMQMGLNYNEKMASLKPHMRVLRSLDKAGLLDESKLNYLIDLSNHKPEAIAQLLKTAEVDTYNLPDLEEKPYQANNYMLSEDQVAFEETVKAVSANPAGEAVLNVIHGWDDESISQISKNPNFLEQLAEQKESPLFDDAMSIIMRDKALGKLDANKPMVELYNDVATYLLVHDPKYPTPSWWSKEQIESVQQYRIANGISNNTNTVPATQQNTVQQRVNQPVQTVQNTQPQRQYLGSNVNQHQAQPKNNVPVGASIPNGQTINPVQTRVTPQNILDMSDDEFEQFQQTVKFIN